MARALQPTADAEALVLAVAQRAQDRLPDRDAPLAERLFALECAARGGVAAALVVERYRDALREVHWWADEHWEPDVPHVVVLAQALSANDALGQEPPAAWLELMTDALGVIERRRTKLGLTRDPALLAAVLRGLAAAGITPPSWLIDAAATALQYHASVEATAELAEALARHNSAKQFTAKAVAAAFSGGDLDDPDAAYARWWLSGRHDIAMHLNASTVDEARLQALASADPADVKAAAMALESASRAAGALIIASAATVSSARSKQERSVRVSRALYRGMFFGAILVLILLNLRHVADALAPTGEAHTYRQVIAAVSWAGIGYCISGTANSIYGASGKQSPEWARYAEGLLTVVAGIVGAITA